VHRPCKTIADGLRPRGPNKILSRAVVAAAAAAVALVVPCPAHAQVATLDGNPVNVYADGLGAIQVRYDNQQSGEFYPPDENPAHAGLELKQGEDYYALDDPTTRAAVQAPVVSGNALQSVYTVGPDVQVGETITYTNGTSFIDIAYTLTNISSAPVSLRAGELADLYVGDSDSGNGAISPVAPRFVGGRDPVSGLVVGVVEQTPWLNYQEGDFEAVFDNFAAGGLNNTVDAAAPDNGVGAEWQVDLQPGETKPLNVRWLLSAPAPPGTVEPGSGGTNPPGVLPPPVAGKTVNVKVAKGKVRIKLPGSKKFILLTDPRQVPLGTIFDTTHGRVTLTSAADKGGGTQHAWFYRGIFKVGQTRGAKPLTDLTLAGPKPSCAKQRKTAHAAAKKRKPKTRRLWGDGKGAFRTTGQFSSATVRGTRWVVIDTCRGTLTQVRVGVVTVRDFKRHKNVVVRAGKQYLARKPK
jgi:hypothetical protein